jgi:hypothetical protein
MVLALWLGILPDAVTHGWRYYEGDTNMKEGNTVNQMEQGTLKSWS